MAISEETNFKNFEEENVSQKFSIEILSENQIITKENLGTLKQITIKKTKMQN